MLTRRDQSFFQKNCDLIFLMVRFIVSYCLLCLPFSIIFFLIQFFFKKEQHNNEHESQREREGGREEKRGERGNLLLP